MAPQVAEPRTRHWTLAEYYQLAEEGWFQGQRVQLIEGEIIQMPPQGHAHFKSLSLIARWLEKNFGPDYWVRVQGPLSVAPDSEPEPDIAVVRGSIEQFHDHPQTALLAVEVGDSSVNLDRQKARVYAAAGVQEYWIVDLPARRIEIYRKPGVDSSSSTGFSYLSPRIAGADEMISPLALPHASVKVAELLQ